MMAVSRLLFLSLFIALFVFIGYASADASTGDVLIEEVVRSEGSSDSSLKVELEKLKSEIRALESQVDEKALELKSKDDNISEKEKTIRELADSSAALQSEVLSLQKKGTLDADERVAKAYARVGELENKVEKLKKEIETKDRVREALESKKSEAEKKVAELNLKLENLQKTVEEQKSRIRKTERALKIAEEEMVKWKFDAAAKEKALSEAHGAWLPTWLAIHLIRTQSIVETHWSVHGKPALEKVVQKVVEKKIHAQKWAEPHVETIKVKWVPAVKEKWLVVTTSVEPHVQQLTTKAKEFYETSKTTVTPHIVKVQETVDPYFQEAKKVSKPYIDQVATATKPHFDKVRKVTKPYTKQIALAYRRFVKSAGTYHQQVQGTVQSYLQQHELTRPFATKELVWFAASALLALPIIFLFRLCSAIFGKKTKKPVRSGHAGHARRKTKRVHVDK